MMTIVVPMAGEGHRFVEAGYTLPKPLIDIQGEPMIRRVVRNLRWIGRYALQQRLVLIGRLDVEPFMPVLRDGDVYLKLDEPTRGAVDTILKAATKIDRDGALLIGNCDQLLFSMPDTEWGADGSIVTFESSYPAHSYVRVNEKDRIIEIAEKRVISDMAVAGIYYFRHAGAFLDAAQRVLEEDTRFNGEFYVSSVIEKMIAMGYSLTVCHSPAMFKDIDVQMLGTPEQVDEFNERVAAGIVRLP